MNYRLIQHYANKFPPEIREDIFQEGCVALLSSSKKNVYYFMIDEFRKWTKYRRRNTENAWQYELSKNLKYEFDTCEAIYLKEVLSKLNTALSKLKPKWRQVIHLRYWEDMKFHEIGARFGVSESAVSLMHQKILYHLKSKLE